MQIVLCVGELERHNDATHIHFVEDQIQTALIDIRKIDSKNITIAYEPVWAIGADAVRGANQNEIYEMTIVIRKKLVDLFGKNSGGEIPIIYGGSVNSQNAKEIMSVHHIDGMLLGRASLDINEMKKIINQIKR
jgi:triosephosphate isomerase